jgi:hypothetical protein
MPVNADPTGLTDEDIELVVNWCDRNNAQLVCPVNNSIKVEMQPYSTPFPAFELACDVINNIAICNK